MLTPSWGILGSETEGNVRHYMALTGVMVAVFLTLFVLVESTGLPLLNDPSADMSGAGPLAAAAIGVGLLIADVLIPVPSSVVMLMHGVLFGAVLGAGLSLVGSVGATLVGFTIGRRGGPLIDRVVPAHERERADAMLARWGFLAILVTRPVPILAETTAILAGASRTVPWHRATLAALVGSVPAAVLYAAAGAFAASFANLSLVFGCVIGIAVIVWVAEWLLARRAGVTGDGTPVHPGSAQ